MLSKMIFGTITRSTTRFSKCYIFIILRTKIYCIFNQITLILSLQYD